MPPDFAGQTRHNVLLMLITKFEAARIDLPDRDARLLLAHALGVESLRLIVDRDAVIETETALKLTNFATRRLRHEPVSRIIGERWFYSRPFKITPDTLDPRPESETLIEAVLALVRETGLANDQLRLLDIGTGTGCLLLTLLAELPGAVGIGIDTSAAALSVAKLNARLLDVPPSRVAWHCGSGFTPVAGQTFNVVLSNPPYIPTSDFADLDPDVRHFDPHVALDGGADGLTMYRDLTCRLPGYLSKGWVIFEVGMGQASAVADLLRAAYTPNRLDVRIFEDLAGVQRCVAASPLK